VQFLSITEIRAGLLILLCGYVFGCVRLLRRRLSNRAISPTLTAIALGFAVIAAHLLIVKWFWGFPWAGVLEGILLVAILAPAIGYFCVLWKRPSEPMRDSSITETFLELGGTFHDPSTLVGRMPSHGVPAWFNAATCDSKIVETSTGPDRADDPVSQDALQSAIPSIPWPQCNPPAIRAGRAANRTSHMAQNRCNRTQKKNRAQLPNVRF
jgi:hypothetical protein